MIEGAHGSTVARLHILVRPKHLQSFQINDLCGLVLGRGHRVGAVWRCLHMKELCYYHIACVLCCHNCTTTADQQSERSLHSL